MGKSINLLVVFVFIAALCIIAVKPASAVTVIENSWVSKEPMPTARVGVGVAVANGKIYVIGGYNGSYLNINEMYDPVNSTWTTKTPMPTSRAYFAIASYQNKIYAIAGSTGTGSSTLVNEVYDSATDTWETVSLLQSDTVREHLSANVVNGKIYVISGVASVFPRGAPSSVENNVYDPSLDVWTKKAPISQPVFQYASAVVDDKIYIIGGRNFQSNPSILSLTQIYDTTNDTWTNGPSMTTAAYWCLSGATTGLLAPKRIYVLGGYSSSGPDAPWLSLNQVYNPQTNAWTIKDSPPKAFNKGGVAMVDDILFAIGNNVNEQYTPIDYGTIQPPPSSSPSSSPSLCPSQQPTPSPELPLEPFPIVHVAVVTGTLVAVVAVSMGLLFYFKKCERSQTVRKKQSN